MINSVCTLQLASLTTPMTMTTPPHPPPYLSQPSPKQSTTLSSQELLSLALSLPKNISRKADDIQNRSVKGLSERETISSKVS